MMELHFLSKKKILIKLKYKIIFLLMYLIMRIRWSLQFIFLIKKFKDSMDLLLLIKDNRSHYVYIKDFNGFIFHKTKKQ